MLLIIILSTTLYTYNLLAYKVRLEISLLYYDHYTLAPAPALFIQLYLLLQNLNRFFPSTVIKIKLLIYTCHY